MYILLGGNLGNRFLNIEKACGLIGERIGKIQTMSSIYETEPWGFDNTENFLNRVVVVETGLDYTNLLFTLQRIEKDLGRIKKTSIDYSSREIDLDILFYNLEIVEDKDIGLIIPHPRLHMRKFVLVPLAELAPHLLHPVFKVTMQELLDRCSDHKWVKKFLPVQ